MVEKKPKIKWNQGDLHKLWLRRGRENESVDGREWYVRARG
jgi:hypothetical protein